MPNPSPSLRYAALAVTIQVLGLLLMAAWWGQRGTFQEIAEPSVSTLPCVSYAPFRRPGATPYDPAVRVSAADIETDLKILQTRSNCVRTYGLANGLDALPAVAAKLGMRVRLGAWIGRDQSANQRELDAALALARSYPGTVEMLIAGNEVLLRRELAPDQLAQHLAYARAHSPVPVTYADVWEFWLKHAALRVHVDLVTAHVLPYWEDQPVDAAAAVAHVYATAAKMRVAFAGQPIWIGETGWPAAGRQRAGAVPGPVEQARFVRELMQRSVSEPLDFNLIEGFDQPWKRAQEGAMGGYWGLFDDTGAARFAMTGPVREDAHWARVFSVMAGGGLAGLAALLLGLAVQGVRRAHGAQSASRAGLGGHQSGQSSGRSSGQPGGHSAIRLALQALMSLAAGALVSTSLLTQHLTALLWNRTSQEWLVSGGLAALCALAVGLFTAQMLAIAGAANTATRTGTRVPSSAPLLVCANGARIALLFCAAAATLILLFDGRYRPFPWWWFAAPTIALLALRVSGQGQVLTSTASRWMARERLLAGIVLLSVAGLALAEGWRNAQALGFCATLGLLAALSWWPEGWSGGWSPRWPGGTNTSAAINAAGAPSSAV